MQLSRVSFVLMASLPVASVSKDIGTSHTDECVVIDRDGSKVISSLANTSMDVGKGPANAIDGSMHTVACGNIRAAYEAKHHWTQSHLDTPLNMIAEAIERDMKIKDSKAKPTPIDATSGHVAVSAPCDASCNASRIQEDFAACSRQLQLETEASFILVGRFWEQKARLEKLSLDMEMHPLARNVVALSLLSAIVTLFFEYIASALLLGACDKATPRQLELQAKWSGLMHLLSFAGWLALVFHTSGIYLVLGPVLLCASLAAKIWIRMAPNPICQDLVARWMRQVISWASVCGLGDDLDGICRVLQIGQQSTSPSQWSGDTIHFVTYDTEQVQVDQESSSGSQLSGDTAHFVTYNTEETAEEHVDYALQEHDLRRQDDLDLQLDSSGVPQEMLEEHVEYVLQEHDLQQQNDLGSQLDTSGVLQELDEPESELESDGALEDTDGAWEVVVGEYRDM